MKINSLLSCFLLAAFLVQPSGVFADCQLLLSASRASFVRTSAAGRLPVYSQEAGRFNSLAVTEAPDPKVYFSDSQNKAIGRTNLSGSIVERLLTVDHIPLGIAIFGEHLYWSAIIEGAPDGSNGAIYRAKLDGTMPEEIIGGTPSVPDLAFGTNGRLYWITAQELDAVYSDGAVYSATPEGGDVQLVADLKKVSEHFGYDSSSIPRQISIDVLENKLYVSDKISNLIFTDDVVWRMNLDGSEAEVFAVLKGFITSPTVGAGVGTIGVASRRRAVYVSHTSDVSGLYRLPIDDNALPYRIGITGGNFLPEFRIADRVTNQIAFLGPEQDLCMSTKTLTGSTEVVDDYTVWRPSLGQWYAIPGANPSHTNFITRQWGLPGDIPLIGDFNGDPTMDMVVWRNTTGTWHICDWDPSGSCRAEDAIQFGLPGDIPLIADVDGDTLSDLTVWRPSNGTWYNQNLHGGITVTKQWGLPGDIPLTEDFNRDGRDDFVVYRPSTGTWFVLYSSTEGDGASGVLPDLSRQWGLPGDIPLLGDYDDDEIPDLVVWRPSTGVWYICSSRTGYDCHGQGTSRQFGLPDDIPIRGNFANDGYDNLTVWRPSTGTWFSYIEVLDEAMEVQWGLPGDIPVTPVRQ